MPAAVRNTVDRLDKPSAYYLARVSFALLCVCHETIQALMSESWNQNRKRKYNRDDRDDRDDGDRTPEEPPEDPLKDATTLYVGNLWVDRTQETSGVG